MTRQFGGLGLAITKTLITMRGGTLSSHSEGECCDAMFCLELQVSAPAEASAVDRLPDKTAALTANSRKQMLKILVVEDHADTAKLMKRLLGSLGHNVETAGSVASALSTAKSGSFDMVISDLSLPDGSGCELIQQLLYEYPIKAIAVSGFGMEEDHRGGADAGFHAYLTKPISLEQLEVTTQKVVAMREEVIVRSSTPIA